MKFYYCTGDIQLLSEDQLRNDEYDPYFDLQLIIQLEQSGLEGKQIPKTVLINQTDNESSYQASLFTKDIFYWGIFDCFFSGPVNYKNSNYFCHLRIQKQLHMNSNWLRTEAFSLLFNKNSGKPNKNIKERNLDYALKMLYESAKYENAFTENESNLLLNEIGFNWKKDKFANLKKKWITYSLIN